MEELSPQLRSVNHPTLEIHTNADPIPNRNFSPQSQTDASAADVSSYSLLYLVKVKEHRHHLYSGIATLTLSIMGGAVLPVSWAFSVTGIVSGFLIMSAVAVANAYTCGLLLKEAHKTGANDYESLSLFVGGPRWKIVTEISILVLLLGSMIGGIQQAAEAGVSGILSISSNVPHWLVGSGRVLTIMIAICIILPLCLVKKISQLEYVATVGTAIVLWLVVVVMTDSIKHGLPAVQTGELASWGFTSSGSIAQAVSIFGFAFYVQPMMMPFLSEMPPGKLGVKITMYSVRSVILGTAYFIYGAAGFFGAAYYGKSTESNILENTWLGGGLPQGILNLSMSLYLAMGCPTMEFPMRHIIKEWIPGNKEKNKLARQLSATVAILAFCTIIAAIWPNNSGTVLTVTGATGVCMVSYVIPITNHFITFYNRRQISRKMEIDLSNGGKRKLGGFVENLKEIAIPLLVLMVGIGCSIATLATL